MNQNMYTPPASQPETPKRNTTLIVIVVLVVLCCVCAIAAGLAWQFGDAALEASGMSF